MASDSVEAQQNEHTIKVWEANKDRLESMHRRISEPPKLLSRAAGKTGCCIFRVPKSLADINGRAYEPRIVSIGPYHRGEPHLRMIEEHKWRYLGMVLERTRPMGLGLEDYMRTVAPLVGSSRECYSEAIPLDDDEFIEMMVVDAFFMIELFRKVSRLVPHERDDPLFRVAWILPFFYQDFLRLENQIPYFVLERLFEMSMVSAEESKRSLAELALEFFNNTMQRPDSVIAACSDLKGTHLLDLVRSSFIPRDRHELEEPRRRVSVPTHLIQSVPELIHAGFKLRRIGEEGESFLVVRFRDGVLEMPTIMIDDFTSPFLLNCVAYEQCHDSSSNHITAYATLLDCLVNTDRDVEYLCYQRIMENYFGTNGEVARFINNLGKDVAFDIDRCYLSGVFNSVHEYYSNSWRVKWAFFKSWPFLSTLAASSLLLLTVAQTFFTVYGYFRPPK
ncbi:hypothetical protein ACJRO7_007616 [Eucalyptus globulus]|uniref:Uncharacterized protein n=1 Tax=Eucalyptus globulus TaxID=34317 RepID=A0ABD3INZ1_EUCGL